MELIEWKKQIELDENVDVSDSWEYIKRLQDANMLMVHEIDEKCLILFCITYEINQEKSLTEVLIYVKKENRGDIRILNKIRRFFEETAVNNNCDCIKVGANFGYKDEAFGVLLERWGYKPDVYRKEI